ncbi:hypothetical protein [Prosthecobacter sp.]|uniref:hypothetical protein n=1 Tax=Prosthecobacter sp. TaxID=1965333 RepID=UPI0037836AF3
MGYYIRVLSTSSACVPLAELASAIEENNLQARLTLAVGTNNDWEQLILSHDDGREIAAIERNLVESGSVASEELEEFADELADGRPASAAQWLLDYFKGVRSIYACQVLSGTEHKNGWEILGAVKNRIWSAAPSILQADREGFSNESGYHILWQFSESAEGDWWMAVLKEGEWAPFLMDLGSSTHREAFFQGLIPEGAKLA